MATSRDLLLSILAMDSYNRGYSPGIEGLGGPGSMIGGARMLDISIPSGSEAAGFYASAYRLADGSTVISYRGTDGLDPFAEGNDILNGWVADAGTQTGQTKLALEFYKDVTHRIGSRSKAQGFARTQFTAAVGHPSCQGVLTA